MVKKLYLIVKKKHIFDGTKKFLMVKNNYIWWFKNNYISWQKETKTIFDGKRTIYDG
jgi:hypothetical protein